MQDGWLSLSEVAKILGVHPSTVRLWSDKGLLPVHRTEGGHRRYLRTEVELWKSAKNANRAAEVDAVIRDTLRTARLQIGEGRLESESWYKKLDEEARAQYRKSGRTLLESLMRYMTSSGEDAINEADAVGFEYAARGRRYGLGSSEATQAFLFFRNILMEGMLARYEAAAVHSPYAWSNMMLKMNAFTDRILLTLLKNFEAYQRGSR